MSAARLAHISYVLSEQDQIAYSGADYGFVASPLSDAWNVALFAAVLAFIAALIFAAHKVHAIRDRIRFFRGRVRTYQDFIPIILRFSLGVALIGAGSQHALLSPAVHQPGFGGLQLILGFLLITGFLLTPAMLCTLALCIGALIMHPTLMNNLEIVASTITLLLLGQAKPGIDDLLGMGVHGFPEKLRRIIPLILRMGLGFSLVLMAITEKLMNPHLFGAVVEQYGLISYLPLTTSMWVLSAILIELGLGIALMLGLQTRIVSALTFIVLSLSFFIFQEEVYAHVTVFGALAALIILGGGSWSIDEIYAKRRQRV